MRKSLESAKKRLGEDVEILTYLRMKKVYIRASVWFSRENNHHTEVLLDDSISFEENVKYLVDILICYVEGQ